MLRAVLKLSIPLILGQIGVIILSFVDSIMVGHVDTASQASMAFVGGIFSFFNILGLGFSFGLMPLITSQYTKGEYIKTGILLRHNIILNLLFSILIMVIALICYYHLHWFKLNPSIINMVKPYYLTQLWSYPLMMIYLSFKQYFDAISITIVGMTTILIANMCNILLDYTMIFGHCGFSAQGLYGAGLATFYARILALILIAICFFVSPSSRTAKKGFWSIRLQIRQVKEMIGISLPISIQMGVESASFTIVMLLVPPLGIIALASEQVIGTITTLGYMIFYGIGAATTILVGRYRVEQQHHLAEKATSTALYFTWFLALILMLFLWYFRHSIGYIFTTDKAVVDMVSVVILPLILYQIGDAMQIIYTGALRGIKDVIFLAIVAAIIHLLLTPTLATIGAYYLGIHNVSYRLMALWMAFSVSLTLLGVILRKRFIHQIRNKI